MWMYISFSRLGSFEGKHWKIIDPTNAIINNSSNHKVMSTTNFNDDEKEFFPKVFIVLKFECLCKHNKYLL